MRGSPGAIDHTWIEDGNLRWHTIGEEEPRAICGSGLLDLVACLLDLEILDESGYLEETYTIPGTAVSLTQKDIREVCQTTWFINPMAVSTFENPSVQNCKRTIRSPL